ncbi:MAG: 23S rRNA (guanosine(2251)-2'-O)-methyltransferase RlmB [Clostridia bacterium]|nr:23S rRNA (guanosine(2251)-2'-O)-methyltransferase RlmB [Clostridia bacterium]
MQDKLVGRNPVSEALRSGADIDKIFVKKDADGSLLPILKKARVMKIPISEVDRRKLDEMSCGENHQGIVAQIPAESYKTVEDILNNARESGESPFVIILDKITDPHNLGSIIRTAHCAGAHGVIIPKHGSAGLNSIAAKTASGATMYTPVARVTNIARTIDELKEQGLWIVGADMNGESMYKVDMKGSIGLVIGNEGEGISRLVREKCDFIAEIPMWGKIDSLNASVAAAILMYEARRQQNN